VTDSHIKGMKWSTGQQQGSTRMLILTRKRNESIRIGEQIVVRVMHTSKGSVKIGIEAPASVRIVRGELQEFQELVGAVCDGPTHEVCDADSLMLQH